MSHKVSLLIVYSSVRSERQGIGLARLAMTRADALGYSAELADPAELDLPLLDRMYKEYQPGSAPDQMEHMAGMIRRADAVCIVSGEYNHGIPPALKNLLDHYLEEWFHKPAGILCYSAGRYGGVRSAMQLRMTLPELGMPTISSLLPVPAIASAVTLDGKDTSDWLTPRLDAFLGELAWWGAAANTHREQFGTPF